MTRERGRTMTTAIHLPQRAVADRLAIPAIDAHGRLFPMDKMEAHRTGQKHLAVSVFVFDGDRLLIQRRAEGKYHCGGLWANTCCTHPYWGEASAACAVRRLREEVGLCLPLVERAIVEYRAAVTNGLVENERVHVFEGVIEAPVPLDRFDRDEVAALRWISRNDLIAEVARDPGRFTPWLRIYLSRWTELALRAAG
jgi:isopentenyl-diphosphate delta-isomerase